MTPGAKVSFVVPCYNLAHFLPECVESIAAQTYRNIEITIVDDHSPDDTRAVCASLIRTYSDREITYVFNDQNLGNIRTYNAGIALSNGKYVWIISPDDRLRSRDIVRRYVSLMEMDDDIGFTFCPARLIINGMDAGLYSRSRYRDHDVLLDGLRLAKDIVDGKFELLAPSVLVRKRCYQEVALYPEDLPHRGDTYVWALIAMQNKVGYLSEEMVDYRVHANSMMVDFASSKRRIQDDIAVLWRVKAEAEKYGDNPLALHCQGSIIRYYAMVLFMTSCRGFYLRLTYKEFMASLNKFEHDRQARLRLHARVLIALMYSAPKRVGRKLWRSILPDSVMLQSKQIARASRCASLRS
jgi:glycosyltransferase involved in cell wall biosynthesis